MDKWHGSKHSSLNHSLYISIQYIPQKILNQQYTPNSETGLNRAVRACFATYLLEAAMNVEIRSINPHYNIRLKVISTVCAV